MHGIRVGALLTGCNVPPVVVGLSNCTKSNLLFCGCCHVFHGDPSGLVLHICFQVPKGLLQMFM